MYAACFYTLWTYTNPFIVLAAQFWQGVVLVNFIFLNHDVIHQLLWDKRDSSLKIQIEVWTGRMACWLPFIGSTFFRQYHGMHHYQFFQGTDDPKSTHFVPRDNYRMKRLKFWGPGLIAVFTELRRNVMPILPKDIQRTTHYELLVNRIIHGSFTIWCIANYGFMFWMKIHLIPHFVFFPIAFMINRIGQHYCCNPRDSALQSTNCIGNMLVDAMMLYEAYHVEHHTFAEFPCYNLKYANQIMRERIYKPMNLPQFSFSNLAWGWLVENRKVYTIWHDLATRYGSVEKVE